MNDTTVRDLMFFECGEATAKAELERLREFYAAATASGVTIYAEHRTDCVGWTTGICNCDDVQRQLRINAAIAALAEASEGDSEPAQRHLTLGRPPMDETERLLVQRGIAAIIDHPSLYMGGPSRNSMRKADAIIDELLTAKRLVSTTCDHSAWKSFKEHGACCPDCGTLLPEKADA